MSYRRMHHNSKERRGSWSFMTISPGVETAGHKTAWVSVGDGHGAGWQARIVKVGRVRYAG